MNTKFLVSVWCRTNIGASSAPEFDTAYLPLVRGYLSALLAKWCSLTDGVARLYLFCQRPAAPAATTLLGHTSISIALSIWSKSVISVNYASMCVVITPSSGFPSSASLALCFMIVCVLTFTSRLRLVSSFYLPLVLALILN